jgi:hypothetical protein
VAEICLQSLQQPQAKNITFEVKQGQNDAVSLNWGQVFSQLQPDRINRL